MIIKIATPDKVFHVFSSDPKVKDPYIVEVGDANFPDGRCTCPDFSCRIEPVLNEGGKPERTKCKHIREIDRLLELAKRKVEEGK